MTKQCRQHVKELEEARTQFSQQIDRVMEEAAARVKSVNTSCELLTAKLRLDIEKTKHETLALQTMYDTREERINVLVMKQRQILNKKVDETLAAGWKQWSAQAAELQVLRADAENRRKEKASTRWTTIAYK